MSKSKSKQSSSKLKSSLLIPLSVVIIAGSCISLINTFLNARQTTINSFFYVTDEVSNEVKNNVGDLIKNRYEKKYHVSNKITVSLNNIDEDQKLEVLRVSDIEFIIVEGENNSNNITSWLEVPGEGVYTVDLKGAEYIVDEENSYILVRVPNPELRYVTIDYKNVKKLLFKNDKLFNDSFSVGESLAKDMLDQGDLLIRKEFSSNQNYYKNAQESAISSIQYIIKNLNKDVDNLQVDVEFYDV